MGTDPILGRAQSDVGITTLTAASVLGSWSQWDSLAQEMVTRRRTLEELPVRVGDVEFMQASLPEALIAVLLLSAIVVILPRPKLKFC
jgi:hypothetical protein